MAKKIENSIPAHLFKADFAFFFLKLTSLKTLQNEPKFVQLLKRESGQIYF